MPIAQSGSQLMLEQMLEVYPDPAGRFDELFEAPRQPRAHWSRLFNALTTTSAEDIRSRRAAAERQIRDSGVTYNVYAALVQIQKRLDLRLCVAGLRNGQAREY